MSIRIKPGQIWKRRPDNEDSYYVLILEKQKPDKNIRIIYLYDLTNHRKLKFTGDKREHDGKFGNNFYPLFDNVGANHV